MTSEKERCSAITVQDVLDELRWKEDQKVTNHEGVLVWLGPAFDAAGKRIGITDCCWVGYECHRHFRMSRGLPVEET